MASATLLIFVWICCFAICKCSEEERNIFNHIFKFYNKDVRPVKYSSDALNISLVFSPIRLDKVNIDSKLASAEMTVWLQMTWDDSALIWDSYSHNQIEKLSMSDQKVWTPDIKAFNGIMQPERVKLVVNSDGSISWVFPATLRFQCSLEDSNINQTLRCSVKFGSWTHHGGEISIHGSVDLASYVRHGDWSLTKAESKKNSQVYSCCSESYEDIQFDFEFVKYHHHHCNR